MKQKKSTAKVAANSKPVQKIVGIGASAGGLEAFTELLRHLPLDLNVAYILVQHLDPSHRSLLSELLARTTQLQVNEITHKTRVERNQIYVIPPNSDLTISHGVLKLSLRAKNAGPARSIDHFLTSLALDQKSNAIAVILSGAGSDGAQGLRAIKAGGGITFAQDEQSAKYDSMPLAAVGTGCVDFVLPPKKIAAELTRLILSPQSIKNRAAANAKSRRGKVSSKVRFGRKPAISLNWPTAPKDSNVRKIFQLLRARTGLDFTFYKNNTIRRRLARRLSMHKIKDLENYIKFLRQHPSELDLLHADLLINVTSFFRNPTVFEQLKRKIFPKLVKGLSGSDTLRIWAAGCSTGQEAYSIAMAYSEFAETSEARVPIQIFASDVNGTILESARVGRYTSAEVAMVNPARLERFFVKEDGQYRVIKPIRDLIIFAQHNLLLDPPFTRVDLISCRNMLIYFESALQQKIIPAFHYSLKPNGVLLLGSSESVGQFHNLFETVEQRNRIYTKKPANNWPRFERPPALPPGKKPAIAPPPTVEIVSTDVQKEADRLVLQKYAPAGVLVDDRGDIIQFRGDVGRYLKLPAGRASFHISKIARDGLSLALERAFNKSRREKKNVRDTGVCFDSRHGFVDIEVVPMKLKSPCFLILFQESAVATKAAAAAPAHKGKHSAANSKQLSEVKGELAAAREHISSLQEEHDTSIEELQASNEEVQSANEELQSLNEELETSNEELESANEELTTLNEELATRNSELRESELRLREQAALLEMAPLLARSTKDRIVLWSQGAEEMYGYTTDEAIGQTAHILLDTKTSEPLAKIQGTLLKEGHWEGEVTHRRKDGKILYVATQWVVHYDGQKKARAILEVNNDITSRKEAESALTKSEEFNRTVLESSPDCIKVLDSEGRVVFVNPAGQRLLETGDAETRAKSYWPGLWEGEAREQAESCYRAALSGKSGHFVAFRRTPKGTPRWWDIAVRPINESKGKPERILCVLRDITEHKKEQLAMSERAQFATLRAEIATEIAGDVPLQNTLQRISNALVNDLDLALVRFWTADEATETLVLQASAGMQFQLNGSDQRIQIKSSRIGRIALRRQPYITNELASDEEVNSPDSTRHESMVSFAGFPLVVANRCIGVFAVYGKAPLQEAMLAELSFAAKGAAQFIHRKQSEEKLQATQAELSRYNAGLETLVSERTASLQELVEQMEEFSYSISHDLRAPARAMEGYANVLLEDYSHHLDSDAKEYLARIIRNSSRMDRMIREILNYSRLSRMQVALKPISLDSVVREIVQQYPAIQPFSRSIEIAPDLEDVVGHESSLMQAISNLLSNACKFVAPNSTPKIKVWTERNNGHVRLVIKDNGIGIKPEYQHRLFGVFERIHPEHNFEGDGIGLAIVRRALERMGGKVGVDSDGVNGSEFWIQLPTAENHEAQSSDGQDKAA